MSAWKLVVNFAIPPALVLTVLLILPTPLVVKKALLVFTRKVLFLNVIGDYKLVHMMMALTGSALAASSVHTYRLGQEALSTTLTPNQRVGILARKWREERNFWIAVLSFLLWSFLWRFYKLMIDHLELKAKVKTLEAQIKQQQQAAGAAGTTAGTAGAGVAAPAPKQPSAPPAAPEVDAATGKRKVT
uniref:BAP29/BAP31 transmembrane domain-containing protein n=1 Tax=Chlamydomonas leiostraca TaxID=1034604 RepID=A0A7S0WTB4_9CHLO|mmetsp:Transcript_27489/g.69949  ORF Transcript_27489/g.69949 Transcript_27489/m.69949 type:complete len:188 (+) Transcript_27489:124-687(+)|eukprot:CAMPEP_0202866136 /NCGR_PEP_ID=MMETSP1391-20130828/7221_1 /ASSEMBLY_ACC=CAM_ASM_000867 /TAXON_ID=1034604 /ORGANISM="Chlamydomonas leiostraca, Strain SAG 11-49" /LENGTH=187 /DNA_ID=CAMNT_0049546059 /DNA_START=124 /DNA_END=687 /DNA_ORIENTATION=-